MSGKVLKTELFGRFPGVPDMDSIRRELQEYLNSNPRTIVVLDDDPTGIQTVHGVNVYMKWSRDIILDAFKTQKLFYIQTNSRSMSGAAAREVNEEIMECILYASKAAGKDFSVISRSDSTLRGHYPLETDTLRKTYEHGPSVLIDGEILIPFFSEGGRFTCNDIHYVQEGEYLIPAGETEFAKDMAFGYTNSDLKLYIEEKQKGLYKSTDVVSIPLEMIRSGDSEGIRELLEGINHFGRVIVNALTYEDLEAFTLGLLKAERNGKRFLFRSAASFVKIYGGISHEDYLSSRYISGVLMNFNPGLIIAGSHVRKTTEQLEKLFLNPCVFPVEVDVNSILSDETTREAEIRAVVREVETLMFEGKLAAVYTSRQVVKATINNNEKNLDISIRVSEVLVEIVSRLSIQPSFVLAKGGITSSDIAVKALGIDKARVLGQILPGVPVILSGSQRKWPNTPYIIFPGNVGDQNSLNAAVDKLKEAVNMFSQEVKK